jgi:hypothetical protein
LHINYLVLVPAYCENHTKHSNTLCGQNVEFWYVNPVHTSQETHYVSIKEPNRLMLFVETVALYCENHTEQTDTLCGQNVEFVPHSKHITSPLHIPTG